MLCQSCQKSSATVHLTEIEEGGKKEIHLCEKCARERGIGIKTQVSLSDLLTGLMASPLTKELSRMAKVSCPVCGHSYMDFRSSGRLGCPNDYTVFRKALIPLLEKVHGKTRHVGKVPAAASETLTRMGKILDLRQRLRKAIQDEQYEEAARLRDVLARLEEEGGSGEPK